MKFKACSSERVDSLWSYLFIGILLLSTKFVRTQNITDLKLTPAILSQLNISTVVPANPSSAATSPFSPYTPAIAASDTQENNNEGISAGQIVGIIIGVSLFVFISILIYRRVNNKSGLGPPDINPMKFNGMQMSQNNAVKLKESARNSLSGAPLLQERVSLHASKQPQGKPIKEKAQSLAQPSLYSEEHAVLDSMDLPILPSNLSASERVRIIIDTLRKSRGNRSRPSTPMIAETPMAVNNVNLPPMPIRDQNPTNVAKSNAPSIPSVPIPFLTSMPPPGFSSNSKIAPMRSNETNVPQGYQAIKPHTRPNKRNSVNHGQTSPAVTAAFLQNPFKEENIDLKVSNMIENVLSHEKRINGA